MPSSEAEAAFDDGYESASSSASSSSPSSSSSSSLAPPILDESFLPRILALFFAIFHPTQGPKVVYQVPEGSVTADEVGDVKGKGKRGANLSSSPRHGNLEQEQLFDFDTLSDYLIPKAPLCGRLITCTTKGLPSSKDRVPRHFKVLSYPVLIEDSEKYERNTFIFNLAFVFDGKADVKSYEPVVRKCARALQGLEQSSSFLSSTLNQPRMYGIVEHLYQDLNSFCEVFVDLPEAPHTAYEKDQRNLALDAISPSFRGHSTGAMVTSASQSSALRATRALSTAADGAIHGSRMPASLLESRRPSAASVSSTGSRNGSRNGSPAIAPATDGAGLPFGMSPIEESSKSGPRRGSIAGLHHHTISPLSPFTSSSMTSPPPAPLTALGAPAIDPLAGSATLPGSRRSSAASTEAHRRPSIKRSKTTSTAAVNEAKASAVSASMQRAFSNGSTGSSSSEDALTRRHALGDRSSYEAIAADLSSSLASLRNVKPPANTTIADGLPSTDPVLSLLPQPPSRAPGQREPPHGLGRTVREAINLKLFPTYANPPPVKDHDVPVSLLDLGHKARSSSSNWDLTMSAVYPYINGINHVKRIAQLADADLELTRQCMEHLLYYGCILTVDVFQFWNVYAVKPAVARMADDPSIQAECGPYVTRPGHAVPAWPTLLALYTALRPGMQLERWIEERQVEALGIDVRRFVTFGVIKGFLRRVHRYPVLMGGQVVLDEMLAWLREGGSRSQSRSRERDPAEQRKPAAAPMASPLASPSVDASSKDDSLGRPAYNRRQPSDGASIRTVRQGDERGAKSCVKTPTAAAPPRTPRFPPSSRYTTATVSDVANIAFDQFGEGEDSPSQQHLASRRGGGNSSLQPGSTNDSEGYGSRSSLTLRPSIPSLQGSLSTATPSSSIRPSFTGRRSANRPPIPDSLFPSSSGSLDLPPDLPAMLDGTNSEDALCVHFGLSWPQLRRMLIRLGRAVANFQQQRERERERERLQRGGSSLQMRPRRRDSWSSRRLSGYAAGGAGGESDDWIPEAPAFANASGFGASGWASGVSGQQGGSNATGSLATSLRSSGKRAVFAGSIGKSGTSASAAGASGSMMSSGSFGPKSWNQSLDGLEIEDEEEELERTGEFGAVVIISI
ncbi:NPR2-domain-containing protein [Jaminaea rosea]|uniref:NPR2-domain-containing protein n=1 Tax=Jaminaea rosea TaxID=1569628 RepID=A0A316V4E9_9BASI|nr:NPR2-domain-containing protein [Jaminaea rosea]PWN31103.1 NPR2-domain-containing protein [Jaminaea rosea]